MGEKKLLITGAFLVLTFSCSLFYMVDFLTNNLGELPSVLSGSATTIFGIYAIVSALLFVAIGIWGFLKPSNSLEAMNRRFTLTARIPGYFLLALIPIGFSIILIVLTKLVVWGLWLSIFSPVTSLIFLLLALVKKE